MGVGGLKNRELERYKIFELEEVYMKFDRNYNKTKGISSINYKHTFQSHDMYNSMTVSIDEESMHRLIYFYNILKCDVITVSRLIDLNVIVIFNKNIKYEDVINSIGYDNVPKNRLKTDNGFIITTTLYNLFSIVNLSITYTDPTRLYRSILLSLYKELSMGGMYIEGLHHCIAAICNKQNISEFQFLTDMKYHVSNDGFFLINGNENSMLDRRLELYKLSADVLDRNDIVHIFYAYEDGDYPKVIERISEYFYTEVLPIDQHPSTEYRNIVSIQLRAKDMNLLRNKLVSYVDEMKWIDGLTSVLF